MHNTLLRSKLASFCLLHLFLISITIIKLRNVIIIKLIGW